MSRVQWRPTRGSCAVCGRRGPIWYHHVVLAQHVRAEGGDVWDFRNALPIGQPFLCHCHEQHHNAAQRIPFAVIPEAAIDFAVDLMGEDRAVLYFRRYYSKEAGHAA